MSDADTDQQLWMVLTLKVSGVQVRMRVTEYRVEHHPITKGLLELKWTRHPESPTNVTHLNIDQIAMVHSEYTTEQSR